MPSLAIKAYRHFRAHGALSTFRVIAQRVRRTLGLPISEAEPALRTEQIVESVRVAANYIAVKADDAKIEEDAQYALRIAQVYVSAMPGGREFLAGRSVIELGPGPNLGTPLILRCWGAARVAVADRFLVAYQPEYHGRLYRRIAELVRQSIPNVDTSPIEQCITEGAHSSSALSLYEYPLEHISDGVREKFDITLSNAVFEHLYHPLKAIRSLADISARPSIGFHQVDFRDHRNFAKPLEYLLLDEFSFYELLTECHTECGNRIRPDEMAAMFATVPFDTVEFEPNMWAEASYLSEFLPRLRAARMSPYAGISEERLRVISGRFSTKNGSR